MQIVIVAHNVDHEKKFHFVSPTLLVTLQRLLQAINVRTSLNIQEKRNILAKDDSFHNFRA